MKMLLLALIQCYRYGISPFLPRACRYHPTCSSYAAEALRAHGMLRGMRLTLWRLLRCHPWGGFGLDPVPPRRVHAACPHTVSPS